MTRKSLSADPVALIFQISTLFPKVYGLSLSLILCLICSLQPCYHLLGKGWPLSSPVCDIPCEFVTSPYNVSGQVWYLIVSIPDLYLLYFCK